MNEYEVTIEYSVHGTFTTTVEADSEDEAFDEVNNWITFDDITWDDPEPFDQEIEMTEYDIYNEMSDEDNSHTPQPPPPWQGKKVQTNGQPNLED